MAFSRIRGLSQFVVSQLVVSQSCGIFCLAILNNPECSRSLIRGRQPIISFDTLHGGVLFLLALGSKRLLNRNHMSNKFKVVIAFQNLAFFLALNLPPFSCCSCLSSGRKLTEFFLSYFIYRSIFFFMPSLKKNFFFSFFVSTLISFGEVSDFLVKFGHYCYYFQVILTLNFGA